MKKSLQGTIAMVICMVFLVAFTGCDASSNSSDDALGDIEAEYAVKGPYTTTMTSVTDFQIFHPRKMDGNHPIITWGNGTGAPTLSYYPLLSHLASWGVVVIASNSTETKTGEDMVNGIDYLVEQNETPGSTFYGKLDTSRIGTTGHSQGGAGAINAANDDRVTCTAPIAPGAGQIGQVTCPIFLITGSNDFIIPATLVRTMSYMPAKAPTIFGIVEGMGHLQFVGKAGNARGYLTAWFMYHLKNDPVAAQAFEGPCEICNNAGWTVEMKDF